MLSKWFEEILEDMVNKEKLIQNDLDNLFEVNTRDKESINEYLKTSTEDRMKQLDILTTQLAEIKCEIGQIQCYLFMEQRKENKK